ncbi:unnamed protein product, partial [Amoebophrya sp. A25]|eukprot:GSA25T00022941001.1
MLLEAVGARGRRTLKRSLSCDFIQSSCSSGGGLSTRYAYADSSLLRAGPCGAAYIGSQGMSSWHLRNPLLFMEMAVNPWGVVLMWCLGVEPKCRILRRNESSEVQIRYESGLQVEDEQDVALAVHLEEQQLALEVEEHLQHQAGEDTQHQQDLNQCGGGGGGCRIG